MKRPIPPEKLAEIETLIGAGLSCREVAPRIGVSVATAIRWTKRAGLVSRRSRLLDPRRRAEIVAAVRDGLSCAEAAARFGVTVVTAERLSGKPKRDRRQLREELLTLVASGVSRRQAAERLDVSIATAIRWAAEDGDLPPAARRAPDPAIKARVKAALEAGMSRREAADAFGLGLVAVARLARRPRLDAARQEQRRRLAEALATGLSRRKAAAAVGLPVATAIRWAREDAAKGGNADNDKAQQD